MNTWLVSVALWLLFMTHIYGVGWLGWLMIAGYVAARVLHWRYWQTRVEDHRRTVRSAATVRRADEQHRQALAGDPRGVYGPAADDMEYIERDGPR